MRKITALLLGVFVAVILLGSLVYAAQTEKVISINPVSSLAKKSLILINKIDGNVTSIELGDIYLYAAIDSRVVVFDISDPAKPAQIGQTAPFKSRIEGLAVEGNTLYAANQTDGLAIIDVSTPSKPTLLGFCDTPGEAWGVAVSGVYAFIADGISRLQVCDVSSPASSTVAGSYTNMWGFSYGVAISGTTVYVGSGDLYILNVSSPTSPSYIGRYSPANPWGFARKGISIVGQRAYVGEYAQIPPGTVGGGLRIIDISSPSSPSAAGFHDTPGIAPDGVAVENNYAYVADDSAGLRVIDVSMPASTVEVGYYDSAGLAEDVAVSGDYIFVADQIGGLLVLRFVQDRSFLPLIIGDS